MAAKKIRLLVIIHSLSIGGAEGQVYELVKRLDKNRYEPVVCSLTSQGAYIDKLRADSVRVVVIGNRLRQVPFRLHRLVRLIRQEKFHIVQNVMFTAAVVGTVVARACGVPVIINCIRSLGFLHYRYRRPVKRILYRMSDCVIANSNQTKALLSQHRIVHASKIHTLYNGVDLDRFHPPADPDVLIKQKAALGIRDYFPIIGTIAHLSPVKNHECLLRAIPKIVAEFPRAAFLLVGAGSLQSRLAQTAKMLGIERHVFFWAKGETLLNCCA